MHFTREITKKLNNNHDIEDEINEKFAAQVKKAWEDHDNEAKHQHS